MTQNPDIDKLLEELRGKDDSCKMDAIWLIETLKITDERITEALKVIAFTDSNSNIRNAANKILRDDNYTSNSKSTSNIASGASFEPKQKKNFISPYGVTSGSIVALFLIFSSVYLVNLRVMDPGLLLYKTFGVPVLILDFGASIGWYFFLKDRNLSVREANLSTPLLWMVFIFGWLICGCATSFFYSFVAVGGYKFGR